MDGFTLREVCTIVLRIRNLPARRRTFLAMQLSEGEFHVA